MWIKKTLTTCAAASLLACSLHAQTDSLAFGEQTLKEINILAKSRARKLQEQAYAVSVVDMKDKYASNPSLSKALAKVTSVRIREDGGVGSNYSFAMNGFSGNQVKFFLNGIPMDNFGTSFSLSTLSANMADRIEVYKGVLPVSLGADALGGAVNIVPRVNANYVDAAYKVGSFGTHRVNVNAAKTDMKSGLTLRANAFYNYSDNDYKVYAPVVDLSTGLSEGDRWVKRFHDGYQSAGIRLESGLVGRSWADYLLVGLIASADTREIQTGATMDAVYGKPERSSYNIIPSIRYRKTNLLIPGLDLTASATYNFAGIHNTDTAAVTYNWLGEKAANNTRGEGYLTDAKIREREWQANVNANYVIDDHQLMTVNNVVSSMNRRSKDAEHPDYPMDNVPQQITKNITGMGYQLRYDRWNVLAFGKLYTLHTSTHKLFDQFLATERYEKVSASDINFGYGTAATFFIKPYLQAKLSFEQAYRMPDADELFGDGYIQKSNTDLRPENSKNLNAGLIFDRTFGIHRLTAEVSYIYRHTKDFIFKGVSLTSDPTTSYTNIGKAVTHGIEASMQYDLDDRMNAGFNLTYQDIKDKAKTSSGGTSYVDGIAESVTYGQRMPNIPYFFVNVDAAYNFRNTVTKGDIITLEYSADYVYKYYLSFPGLGRTTAKKYIPTQMSHNAAVMYAIKGGTYSVGLECTNITDEKLYDNYRLQKPGRTFMAKFRIYLSKM